MTLSHCRCGVQAILWLRRRVGTPRGGRLARTLRRCPPGIPRRGGATASCARPGRQAPQWKASSAPASGRAGGGAGPATSIPTKTHVTASDAVGARMKVRCGIRLPARRARRCGPSARGTLSPMGLHGGSKLLNLPDSPCPCCRSHHAAAFRLYPDGYGARPLPAFRRPGRPSPGRCAHRPRTISSHGKR